MSSTEKLQRSAASNSLSTFHSSSFVLKLSLRRTATELPTSGIRARFRVRDHVVKLSTIATLPTVAITTTSLPTNSGRRSCQRASHREVAPTDMVYPMLTRMNYTKWSLMMKVNLQAVGLWDVIESGDGDYCSHCHPSRRAAIDASRPSGDVHSD
jgi:hypothetical protein